MKNLLFLLSLLAAGCGGHYQSAGCRFRRSVRAGCLRRTFLYVRYERGAQPDSRSASRTISSPGARPASPTGAAKELGRQLFWAPGCMSATAVIISLQCQLAGKSRRGCRKIPDRGRCRFAGRTVRRSVRPADFRSRLSGDRRQCVLGQRQEASISTIPAVATGTQRVRAKSRNGHAAGLYDMGSRRVGCRGSDEAHFSGVIGEPVARC